MFGGVCWEWGFKIYIFIMTGWETSKFKVMWFCLVRERYWWFYLIYDEITVAKNLSWIFRLWMNSRVDNLMRYFIPYKNLDAYYASLGRIFSCFKKFIKISNCLKNILLVLQHRFFLKSSKSFKTSKNNQNCYPSPDLFNSINNISDLFFWLKNYAQ